MRNRNIFWLVALMIMATVLAACGGGGDAGGNGGGTTTTTTVELTETFTADDGSISFKYPSGWVVEGMAGTAALANSAEALSSTEGEPAAGQFRAQFISVPVALMPGLSAESTATEVLTFFSQSMPTEDMPAFGEATELTVGSFPAARIEGSNDALQAALYAVNVGEGVYVIVIGGSAAGELANFDSTLQAVLGSLTASAPEIGG